MLTTDQQKLIIFLVAWCGFTDQEAMEFIKLFWGEKRMKDIQTLTDAEFDRRLQEKEFGPLISHPLFPLLDWQYAVCSGTIRAGYWEWVLEQLRAELAKRQQPKE